MSTGGICFEERPKDWQPGQSFVALSPVLKTNESFFEKAGPLFYGALRRNTSQLTLSEEMIFSMITVNKGDGKDPSTDRFRKEVPQELLGSDPAQKMQDHYMILGLEDLRWKATQGDIKSAYRYMALKYHPDKHKGVSNYFRCVQRAFVELSNREKKMNWDSVDPAISDSIPGPTMDGDFFENYGPIFEREARFSNKGNPPPLGDMNTPMNEVETFYSFWLNFDSWRRFDSLEIDSSEELMFSKGKRYVQNSNKTLRASKKKEDNKRICALVNQAFSLDPRLNMILSKKEKSPDSKKREIFVDKKNDEELERQKLKEKEELAKKEREKFLNIKKENKLRKDIERRNKKAIREIFEKNNRFLPKGVNDPIKGSENITKMETLICKMSPEMLAEYLERLQNTNPDLYCEMFNDECDRLNKKTPLTDKEKPKPVASSTKKEDASVPWSEEETDLLCKALNEYTPEVTNRWDRISAYIYNHLCNAKKEEGGRDVVERTPRELMEKNDALKREFKNRFNS